MYVSYTQVIVTDRQTYRRTHAIEIGEWKYVHGAVNATHTDTNSPACRSDIRLS